MIVIKSYLGLFFLVGGESPWKRDFPGEMQWDVQPWWSSNDQQDTYFSEGYPKNYNQEYKDEVLMVRNSSRETVLGTLRLDRLNGKSMDFLYLYRRSPQRKQTTCSSPLPKKSSMLSLLALSRSASVDGVLGFNFFELTKDAFYILLFRPHWARPCAEADVQNRSAFWSLLRARTECLGERIVWYLFWPTSIYQCFQIKTPCPTRNISAERILEFLHFCGSEVQTSCSS